MPLSPADLISDGYRDQLRTLSENKVWGGGGGAFAKEVLHLLNRTEGKSVLDYGCGPGALKAALLERCPGLDVYEYDPGIPGKDDLPTACDVVACTDVMEHVEPDKLGITIEHIYNLTNRAALMSIATRPAEKRLPDGRNAHLIIDNGAWWVGQFVKFDWTISVRSKPPHAEELKLWLFKKWA